MSVFEKLNNWARTSVLLKLLTIGFIILVLLIPSIMVSNLIYERQQLRDSAIREVSSKWGGNQTVGGPVISVPYESEILGNDKETKTVVKGWVHFLPDRVAADGKITPSKRYRGIYVVVLYNTLLNIQGSFGKLQAQDLRVPEADIMWDKALFTLGISDMAGIESAIKLRAGGQEYDMGPGTVTNDIFPSGVSVPIDINPDSTGFDFNLQLNLNGSTDLFFTPFGKETTVNLTSEWANPSFDGTFLPDRRAVSEEGFTANWTVLQLNRNYEQQGVGRYISAAKNLEPAYDKFGDRYYDNYQVYNNDEIGFRNQTNAFGVRLMLPIDEYQKTKRSEKYALFFIFITFLTFFFIEVLNNKRLHPIQYFLVGAAIVLFYVLLLSISEHLSFNWSYLISCALILSLITGYCSFILQSRKLTFLMFGVLAILYGFFWSLLQLQDYALLLGSAGLLLILATVMYLTRNVDWYGRDVRA